MTRIWTSRDGASIRTVPLIRPGAAGSFRPGSNSDLLPFEIAFMKRSPAFLLALLALLLGSSAIEAQSIPSPYRFVEKGQEAGIFSGYFSAASDRFGLGPKSAPAFGARYAVGLSGTIALETVATMAATPRDVVNPNRVEGDRVIEEAESLLTLLEARLRFALTGRRTWHGLQPFVLIGVGVGWDSQGAQAEDALLADEDQFDFGTKFTGSFGGGFRYLITDRFHFRGDATAMLYQIGVPDGFREAGLGLGDVAESEWVTSNMLTLGFAFRF